MARRRLLVVAGCVFGWGLAFEATCHAQQTLASPRIGGYSTGGPLDPIGAGGVGRPAVSPYTNLYLADAIGMSGAYQTLVQPFVQQRQTNNGQTASIHRLQQQVSTVESNVSTRRAHPIIRDTGHQTRNLNYSHYFPTANQ